jgi:putative membrane protein
VENPSNTGITGNFVDLKSSSQMRAKHSVGDYKMNIRLISVLATLAMAASMSVCEAKSGGANATAKTAATVSASDKNLMVKIAHGNMAELRLSEYAQGATSNQQVKDFAKMMLDGHTAMGNQLSNIAAGKGVSLPSTPDPASQATLDRLKGVTGPALDKAYMANMVAGHRKVLSLLRSLAAKSKVAEVKQFAQGGIPDVTKHLDAALTIQKSLVATAATPTQTTAH